jgi:NDP-sugar pyrophosphorylase family protein
MKTKTDVKNRFVIILAGGRGERFWPGNCAFDRFPRF